MFLCGLYQLTRCEVHVSLVIAALQGVQSACHLAGEILSPVNALTLQVMPQVCDVILIAIQDGRFSDAQRAAGIVALATGVPEALPGLSAHEGRGDVVDLVGRFGAGAFLRLGHAAALAPTSAGVEDEDEAQDGQKQGDHAPLQTNRQRQTV